MARDNREILQALRFELRFLEHGGYGRSPRTPWRAPAIFEDSPTCLNFSDATRPHPCNSCLLINFVPREAQTEDVPCRFIPMTQDGRTVDDFYRTATQFEMEVALALWLRTQIQNLERSLAEREGGLSTAGTGSGAHDDSNSLNKR
jgi:hypothetical protein